MADTDPKVAEQPPEQPKKKPSMMESLRTWWASAQKKTAATAAARREKDEQLKTSKKSGGEIVIPAKPDERVYNPFDWVVYVLRWSSIQTALPIIVAVCLWGLYYVNTLRPLQVIEVPPPMQERLLESFKASRPTVENPRIELVSFRRFLRLTLRELNTFSYEYFSVEDLRGLINPAILDAADQSYKSNEAAIRENAMTRSLTVVSVDPLILQDPVSKRYDAYVSGYLTETSLRRGRPQQTRILPYRAIAECVLAPEIARNRTGFFLVNLTEVAGTDGAAEFDRQRQQKLKETGLSSPK